MIKPLIFILYAATIPISNWMIGNVGSCSEHGPCLIPVGFGLMAPSGVLLIGVALVLRDFLQFVAGWRVGLAAICAGAAISFAVAPVSLAVASGAAFFLSEFSDFAVYTPLARRRLAFALISSCVVGAVVDSAAFLFIAFGSLDFIGGQIVGKTYAAGIAAMIIPIARHFAVKESLR